MEGQPPIHRRVLLGRSLKPVCLTVEFYYQIAAKPCSPQCWNFVKDSMMLSNIPSGTTMPDFPEHHPPGNWRPIIRETDSDSSSVSSSSENVSQKG